MWLCCAVSFIERKKVSETFGRLTQADRERQKDLRGEEE